MTDSAEQSALLIEAHDLIVGLIEDRLSPQQHQRLESLVMAHDSVCEMYVTYMHQRCLMAALAQPAAETASSPGTPPSVDSMHDTMVLEAISRESADEEKNSPRPVPRRLPL